LHCVFGRHAKDSPSAAGSAHNITVSGKGEIIVATDAVSSERTIHFTWSKYHGREFEALITPPPHYTPRPPAITHRSHRSRCPVPVQFPVLESRTSLQTVSDTIPRVFGRQPIDLYPQPLLFHTTGPLATTNKKNDQRNQNHRGLKK
jgi:hypothetical protein